MARKSVDPNAELFAAFTAFMQAQAEATPAPARKSQGRTSKPQGRKASAINAETAAKVGTAQAPARKTAKGAITCQQAWEALGGDPTYKPSNPTAPARNAQLWALNSAGKLRLA